MAEMTRRERVLAASRGKRADRLPFYHYWRHSQIGWAERECRNRGMGMNWTRPCYIEKLHDVEVIDTQLLSDAGETLHRRTYTTPVGSIYQDERRDPGVGQWHAQRSWNDVTPWVTSRLVKEPEDYEVLKFVVEHTEYIADYFPIEQAMEWLGDDGVVLDALPHSPMQMLMIDWVGSEGGRFFYHLVDHPELVEGLYEAISKSRESMYSIAAGSPAPISLCGDNLDAFLVNPNLFERYFLPEYEKEAALLHAQGKLMAVHMDGRLRALKDQIAQSPVDIIEALHPPPMGDVPIGEALSAWPDKTVWVGFPGSEYALGTDAVQRHAIELLRDVAPGDRLAIAMSSENLVSNEGLVALTSVLEHADLPLTETAVDDIERKLELGVVDGIQ
jgi:hypothetical protein